MAMPRTIARHLEGASVTNQVPNHFSSDTLLSGKATVIVLRSLEKDQSLCRL